MLLNYYNEVLGKLNKEQTYIALGRALLAELKSLGFGGGCFMVAPYSHKDVNPTIIDSHPDEYWTLLHKRNLITHNPCFHQTAGHVEDFYQSDVFKDQFRATIKNPDVIDSCKQTIEIQNHFAIADEYVLSKRSNKANSPLFLSVYHSSAAQLKHLVNQHKKKLETLIMAVDECAAKNFPNIYMKHLKDKGELPFTIRSTDLTALCLAIKGYTNEQIATYMRPENPLKLTTVDKYTTRGAFEIGVQANIRQEEVYKLLDSFGLLDQYPDAPLRKGDWRLNLPEFKSKAVLSG